MVGGAVHAGAEGEDGGPGWCGDEGERVAVANLHEGRVRCACHRRRPRERRAGFCFNNRSGRRLQRCVMDDEVVLVQGAYYPAMHRAPERRRRSSQRRVDVLVGVKAWCGRTGEKPVGHDGLERRRRLHRLVREPRAVPVMATEVLAVPTSTPEAAEVVAHMALEAPDSSHTMVAVASGEATTTAFGAKEAKKQLIRGGGRNKSANCKVKRGWWMTTKALWRRLVCNCAQWKILLKEEEKEGLMCMMNKLEGVARMPPLILWDSAEKGKNNTGGL